MINQHHLLYVDDRDVAAGRRQRLTHRLARRRYAETESAHERSDPWCTTGAGEVSTRRACSVASHPLFTSSCAHVSISERSQSMHRPPAQDDDGTRHVGMPMPVDAHVVRTREAENLGDATSIDQVIRVNQWRHVSQRISGLGSVRHRLRIHINTNRWPRRAPTPRGPAGTYTGGPDMHQSIPSPLDELAGKATITIEQTAKLLGLGRTAAYDAARRGRAAYATSRSPSARSRPRAARVAGSGVMQGHIHKRVRTDRHGKETARWYVVLNLGFGDDGRRRQKWHGGFRTRREAEAARAKLVTEVNSGAYVVPGRTTLAEWTRDSWLPMTEPRVKATTFAARTSGTWSSMSFPPSARNASTAGRSTDADCAVWAAARRMAMSGRDSAPRRSATSTPRCTKSSRTRSTPGCSSRMSPQQPSQPGPKRRSSGEIQAWEPDELARFLEAVRETRLAAIWRL